MREDQIEAAAVDIEGLAEMRLAHRRAFDVPARPAPAPRAVPARLIRRRRLPQHEIAGVALVGRDLDPGAGEHVLAAAARQPAVVRLRGDREQHMALGLIGVADAISRSIIAIICGTCSVQRGSTSGGNAPSAAMSSWNTAVVRRGQRRRSARLVARRGDDLVVDVGDVAHIDAHVGAEVAAQQPVKHVEDHDGRALPICATS